MEQFNTRFFPSVRITIKFQGHMHSGAATAFGHHYLNMILLLWLTSPPLSLSIPPLFLRGQRWPYDTELQYIEDLPKKTHTTS
jgi:hypothetical protein